ncbi:MFS transporter [Streptacidiphilus rugosus]|uniref:MFS transporter n=1 Tax=Streptacidiphilus rugosus TaxID=405783 RepID=UPI000563B963|nr:MFS transporter [Streptacidiphilus rugosus]
MKQKLREPRSLQVLYAGSFLGNFDRIVITPLLLPAAKGLHVSVPSVTGALTAYLLLFGLMQPVHGLISDAVGRVKVMCGALLGMCLADLLSAFAPDLWVLVLGRAIAGASAAALLPVAVAYVGDRVPFERRQRTVATVLAAGAVGTAGATVIAGVFTHLWSWRAAILLVAICAPVLALWVARLPEAAVPKASGVGVVGRFAEVFRIRWFRFLVVFGLIEGAAMLGFFNFFNAALQAKGHSVLIAGFVTGSYGLAAVAGGMVVRALGQRVSAATLFAVGGVLLLAGYLACAYTQTLTTVLVASVLSGLAFALVQSIVQTWATEVAEPRARGIATSLVACAVFTGAALATELVKNYANKPHFGLLFAVAAVVTVPVAVIGPVARARFAAAFQQQAASAPASAPVGAAQAAPQTIAN